MKLFKRFSKKQKFAAFKTACQNDSLVNTIIRSTIFADIRSFQMSFFIAILHFPNPLLSRMINHSFNSQAKSNKSQFESRSSAKQTLRTSQCEDTKRL